MENIDIDHEKDLFEKAVTIISVEKIISKKYPDDPCYAIETNVGTIFLYGNTGSRDAKILKEEFEGKGKNTVLYGYFYTEGIMFAHPVLPFILNAPQKDE